MVTWIVLCPINSWTVRMVYRCHHETASERLPEVVPVEVGDTCMRKRDLEPRPGTYRSLQLADLFTSCLTAYIAGEGRWSPPVAESLRYLLRMEMGRRGGCGVKLHPDLVYSNLYHWLFGDEYFVRGNSGFGLPMAERPYGTSPDRFRG